MSTGAARPWKDVPLVPPANAYVEPAYSGPRKLGLALTALAYLGLAIAGAFTAFGGPAPDIAFGALTGASLTGVALALVAASGLTTAGTRRVAVHAAWLGPVAAAAGGLAQGSAMAAPIVVVLAVLGGFVAHSMRSPR